MLASQSSPATAWPTPVATTGTLTAGDLQELVTDQAIHSDAGITADQIQPASLDLVLAAEAWRMPGSVLPRSGEPVRAIIEDFALEAMNLSKPTCLMRGGIYLIRLREQLRLPEGIEAYTNNKSSTGRIDCATRTITDGSTRYDRIAPGYAGEVWLEVTPRSFDVAVQSGCSLNQAIFFRRRQVLDHQGLLSAWTETPLLYNPSGQAVSPETAIVDDRVVMRADLTAPIVGYEATRSHRPLALHRTGTHDPADYFTPIPRPHSGFLFLEKDHFYILATRERVLVPTDLACEMVPYDPAAGEFRAHYAGFFDPGFGVHGQGPQGTCAVLEVRPHEDDLILRDGQPICAMAYERLTAVCARPYGGSGSHYARQQGPHLSKYFRRS